MQTAATPVLWHLQMAYAFTQPAYSAPRSVDNFLHRFVVHLGQITRRPSVPQQSTQMAVGHERHANAGRMTAPTEQTIALKLLINIHDQ
jgi:hypothetical protein